MVDTYVAKRRIKTAPGVYREPGQLYPEAANLYRLDSWLHTGYIGSISVSEAEYLAAVAQFCPEQAAELEALVGLAPEVRLVGPRSTPVLEGHGRPTRPPLISLLEQADGEGSEETPKRGRRRAPAKSEAG